MKVIYVGVGEFSTSESPGEVVKTLALGSCVAVIVLDPKNRVVGLLHVALPDSSINKKRAEEKPGMFADTGIDMLLGEMKKYGYDGKSRLTVKLAGGARIMDLNDTFDIGKRNILAVRKYLWRYQLGAIAEDVGGTISRTVAVDVNTGKVKISSPARGDWEL
ncbi:MAG: chemotaxis protein CheD [Calditrichaeota bacterium]|nr:chemotaxis protein CheD [Calditrichota bacterium]